VIKVPSLNEREDIPLLISILQTKLLRTWECKKEVSKDTDKLLQEYDWTGNIRELRNVVNV
jgi:DNA-binding NtrC family response regulator